MLKKLHTFFQKTRLPANSDDVSAPTKKCVEISSVSIVKSHLPTRVEDFNEHYIKILRRLDKHAKKDAFSGILAKESDISDIILLFENLGLLRITSYKESLLLCKNDSLKQILKKSSLPSTGKKEVLVDRILNNVDEYFVQCSEEYSDFYVLTSNGWNLVNSFYKASETEHINFFKDVINLIMLSKVDSAFKMICKRNMEAPSPPGLGCDWKDWFYSGLEKSRKEKYKRRLSAAKDKLVVAISIYHEMSGDSIVNIQRYLRNAYDSDQTLLDDILQDISINATIDELQSLVDCGCTKYTFLASLDNDTCDICGSLDGKSFIIEKATIGENCPPMHHGCRCTIVATRSKNDLKHSKRKARNPITGKSEFVPGDINFATWKKLYS